MEAGKINNPIKFGTDGWRAVIAQDFTFDNVRVCAQALADFLEQTGLSKRGVVVGYDTRFASDDFAAASAEVLAGRGIKVYLSPHPAPTPAISYGVLAKEAGGGIVITASHNPARYNGFKIKSADGASAPTEIINEVEKNVAKIYSAGGYHNVSQNRVIKQELIESFDIFPDYQRKISTLVDTKALKQANLKVVVDSMYGAGSGYFNQILSGGEISIEEINAERNPAFPGNRAR